MGMNEKLIWTDSHEADATFALKQYYGCKYSADEHVTIPTNDADIPAGLVLNNPASGEVAQVLKIGRAPGYCVEDIAYGEKVRIDSAGKVALWETTDTTCHCVGICVKSGDADEMGVFDFCFPSAIDTA